MSDVTFREWLAERVGDEPGKTSRRELARRLAVQSNVEGNPDTYRRTIRRILDGSISSPTQATRNSIQDALEDRTAPSVKDEEEGDLNMTLKMLARESLELNRRISQVLQKTVQTA